MKKIFILLMTIFIFFNLEKESFSSSVPYTPVIVITNSNSLLAEAEGLDKKAEAMKKYGDGALLEMYFKALPEIAKNVASPLEKVDKITMYGDGNGEKMIGDITKMIEKVNSGVGDSLGIDLKSIVAGYLGKGLMDKINKKVDNEDITDKS